jgi:2-desacetyl-2-hydroxyethyl bacteriochlorophyllide A dehydrogenase
MDVGHVRRTLALQFTAPRRVEWIEVGLPPPLEGQILAASLYSGISSGTEGLAYRGELDPDTPVDETIGALGGTFTYPFRYGYSCVARVEESSAALAPGTLVFCMHPHQRDVVVRAADVVVVDGIPPRVATLFPLVETALQVSLDAGTSPDDVVVVIGLGAVGIISGALLARAGARVVGVDPLEGRRAAAATFSFEGIPPDGASDAIRDLTEGRGADLVVEASGNPTALAGALDLAAHEGTVLVASWYGTRPASLPLGGAFHRRRLVIRSTQVSTIPARLQPRWTTARRRRRAAALMRELALEALATHEFPYADAAAAYEAIDRGAPGLIHAALSYV